jgi:hypothetical protein
MTTYAQAREAIYQEFFDAWGSTTVFTFDNEKFDPPKNDSWVRLSVRHQAADQETLGKVGNRRFMRSGLAIVQVYIPIDGGMAAGDSLIALVKTAFEGKRLTGSTVRFFSTLAREIGSDGKWFQINVETPFDFEEIR